MRKAPPFLEKFVFRTAETSDIPAIFEILARIDSQRSSAQGFLNSQLVKMQVSARASATLVAIKDGEVAGFAVLNKPIVPGKRYSSIHVKQLGVAPKFQRCKCATSLYLHISRACRRMTAKVRSLPEPNTASLRFHANLGFQQDGISTCNGRESLILGAASTSIRNSASGGGAAIDSVCRRTSLLVSTESKSMPAQVCPHVRCGLSAPQKLRLS